MLVRLSIIFGSSAFSFRFGAERSKQCRIDTPFFPLYCVLIFLRYDYNWAVKDDYSGNNYGQNENRDGAVTSGSYFVLLPDGRIQRVTYTVDGQSGFVAHVTYETPGGGYPSPSPKPVVVTARPAYKG